MNTKVKNSYLVDSLIFVFLLLIIVSNLNAQTAGSGFSVRSVTGANISSQKVIGSYSGFDIDGDGNG